MASVHSPVRNFLKPILFKLFGKSLYPWFQFKAKVRDIDLKLVEEKEMELLPKLLSSKDQAIDIGANYAYYTHRLAKVCAKVYAFEPVPFTHKVCSMVIKHYKFKNVELFKQGVGEKNEWHKFAVPITDFGAISAGQAHFGERNDDMEGKEIHARFTKNEMIDCEVIALDSMLEKFSNLRFIKIDIEGAEFFALKGMRKTIEKFKPVILMEINPFFLKGFNLEEKELEYLIAEMGYVTFVYDDAIKQVKEWQGNYIENNYLLFHKENISSLKNLINHEN